MPSFGIQYLSPSRSRSYLSVNQSVSQYIMPVKPKSTHRENNALPIPQTVVPRNRHQPPPVSFHRSLQLRKVWTNNHHHPRCPSQASTCKIHTNNTLQLRALTSKLHHNSQITLSTNSLSKAGRWTLRHHHHRQCSSSSIRHSNLTPNKHHTLRFQTRSSNQCP